MDTPRLTVFMRLSFQAFGRSLVQISGWIPFITNEVFMVVLGHFENIPP
jgi:hypothetical protein